MTSSDQTAPIPGATSSTTPMKVAEAASSPSVGPDGVPSMSTKIGSLADLREKAPKVYNMMMVGIATVIINTSRRRQMRINQMIRQGSRDAG